MSVQSNNNNLNYLIDPTFTRLFVLPFARIKGNTVKRDRRDSSSNYYVPNVEKKRFQCLNQ